MFTPDSTLQSLDVQINREPLPPEDILEEYRALLGWKLNKRNPRYFAFVDTGNVWTNLLAAPFIELFNQNQLVAATDSPKSTFIELRLINWIRSLVWGATDVGSFGRPQNALGCFCSSGSTANLLGLLTARSRAFPKAA